MTETFAGDKKEGQWLTARLEDKVKAVLVPRVPKCIETYHLTYTTILWSAGVIIFSWMARYNILWLWLVSLNIFLQYITDLLDGAVGRTRNTGLIKWGYYMDHLLDYLFLCAILIGYMLLLPDQFKYIQFFILALFGAFMVNSFLEFAATNAFRISYLGIGPTEVRGVFILVNTIIIFFGRELIVMALPYVLWGALFGLFVTVYKTQKAIWKLDMDNKAKEAVPDDAES